MFQCLRIIFSILFYHTLVCLSFVIEILYKQTVPGTKHHSFIIVFTFFSTPSFFRHQKDSGSWSIYNIEDLFNENCILILQVSFCICQFFNLCKITNHHIAKVHFFRFLLFGTPKSEYDKNSKSRHCHMERGLLPCTTIQDNSFILTIPPFTITRKSATSIGFFCIEFFSQYAMEKNNKQQDDRYL